MRIVRKYWLDLVAILATGLVFVVPFLFILSLAMKDKREASARNFSWPSEIHLWQNIVDVVQTRDYMLLLAFWNSTIMTVGAVTILVVLGAMVGFVMQRRPSGFGRVASVLIMLGLMMPPAVVPTIWVLQSLGLFKTMHSMILIQVAYGLAFCILLFRAFVASIPKEVDEAAIIDGAGPIRLFFSVILPLLRPVVVTVIVVQSVAIFNDFTNPLYYFPGNKNVTVQLTLYNFQSQFQTAYNLLFTNILLITIPPLIVFLFFSRQIVSGMTAGAIKG